MVIKNIHEGMRGYDKVVALQKSAFPPEESFTMRQILDLAESDHIEYKSFWDDGYLAGILFYNIGDRLIYLFYLAVNPQLRSKGYGGRLLTWLKENYPDKDIVGNIEPVGTHAANEEQRIRRFAFYERNGFARLPYRLLDDSGQYDIISNGDSFDKNEYMKLINELGFDAYRPSIIDF